MDAWDGVRRKLLPQYPVAAGSVQTYMALQEQMSRVLERLTRVENVQKMLFTEKRSKSDLRPLEARPEMSAMNEVNNRLRKLEEGHQLLHESVTRQRLPSELGGRSQWQKNVSTKLGILFQELVNITATAERAEKLAKIASAASKELADKADSQTVHQDSALKQSNQLRTLEQQIGNALDERGRALKELQLSLRSEVEARGRLQQKVDWLLQSQDKAEANKQESLSIVAGNIDNRIQIEIDKNRAMLEQTRQHLAVQLENQHAKNASEFMKIERSFAALKQQIDADMAQMRSHISQVQPTSAEKPPSDTPNPTELQLAPMQHQQTALAAQMETHQHALDLMEGVLREQDSKRSALAKSTDSQLENLKAHMAHAIESVQQQCRRDIEKLQERLAGTTEALELVTLHADEKAQDRMVDVDKRVKNIQTQMNIRKWHHEVELHQQRQAAQDQAVQAVMDRLIAEVEVAALKEGTAKSLDQIASSFKHNSHRSRAERQLQWKAALGTMDSFLGNQQSKGAASVGWGRRQASAKRFRLRTADDAS